MNLREVAAYLRVHPNTIYRLARSGRLPAFKIGTDWRFQRAAVDAFLQARSGEAGAAAADDVLDLLYWLLGEGLSLSTRQEEISRILDWRPAEVRDAIRRLTSLGLVSHSGSEVTLTSEGMTEARRRSARALRPRSGHDSMAAFQERFSLR